MGQEKDNLEGKAKAAQAGKAKQRIHSYFLQQAEVWPCPVVMVTWEHKLQMFSLPASLPIFTAEQNTRGSGTSLG